MPDTDWPFDADQHDPLAALRIPVVRNPHPRWPYEVALVISDEVGYFGPALRPDDAEVRQIVAFLEYRMDWYRDGWKAQMRRRPLDTDETTNTVVLLKRGEGDWCYRRDSWRSGPFMVPVSGEEPLILERLLDRVSGDPTGMGARWAAWKTAHPEAFPVEASR